MLADVPHEVDGAYLFEPVRVVDQEGRVILRVEVQKPRELRSDALQVRLKALAREQRTLLGLAARVTDEAGAAASDRDRPMAVPLHPDEHHDAQEVADVQAVGGRVEADVCGDLFTRQQRVQTGREQLLAVAGDMDEPSPPELVDDRTGR